MSTNETLGLGELRQAAEELAARLAWVRDSLDPAALAKRLDELGVQLSAEGFWDDPRRAAQVSSEHARTDRKLQTFRTIESEIEDLPTTLELVEEDESLLPEAAASLERIKGEVDHLQEQALFTGEYDAGNALGTL